MINPNLPNIPASASSYDAWQEVGRHSLAHNDEALQGPEEVEQAVVSMGRVALARGHNDYWQWLDLLGDNPQRKIELLTHAAAQGEALPILELQNLSEEAADPGVIDNRPLAIAKACADGDYDPTPWVGGYDRASRMTAWATYASLNSYQLRGERPNAPRVFQSGMKELADDILANNQPDNDALILGSTLMIWAPTDMKPRLVGRYYRLVQQALADGNELPVSARQNVYSYGMALNSDKYMGPLVKRQFGQLIQHMPGVPGQNFWRQQYDLTLRVAEQPTESSKSRKLLQTVADEPRHRDTLLGLMAETNVDLGRERDAASALMAIQDNDAYQPDLWYCADHLGSASLRHLLGNQQAAHPAWRDSMRSVVQATVNGSDEAARHLTLFAFESLDDDLPRGGAICGALARLSRRQPAALHDLGPAIVNLLPPGYRQNAYRSLIRARVPRAVEAHHAFAREYAITKSEYFVWRAGALLATHGLR